MGKIFTIGETTYDIHFRNGKPTGAVVGGSTLNTSVSLGRLGLPVHFVSRMGNDRVGELSIQFLRENHVYCDHVVRFEGNSRLALAFIDENNNAAYQFYDASQAPPLFFPDVEEGDIVTFGSTQAIREEGRNSLLCFLNQAHEKNVITLYDPNIREARPPELIEVRNKFEENLHLTKILKGSSIDFQRLYNTAHPDTLFEKFQEFGIEALIVTAGAEPVSLRTNAVAASFRVKKVKTISTIGAGDNFTAGLIFGLIKEGIQTGQLASLKTETWENLIRLATAFASEVCQLKSNYITENFAIQVKELP